MRESYKQRCLKAEAQLAEYQRKLAEARQTIDWLKQLLRGGATEPQGDLISRDALLKDVDAEYAWEKIRQEAEKISRMKITYLYEAEMKAAREKHKKEGWE